MRDPASLLNEAKMGKSKKPCQADRLAGLFMVGVARIELATPAMSTKRCADNLLKKPRVPD
ncbi:hypothetical protein [Sphingomonas sp. ABOLG]|uniref:hypothetical protein n=1 Tax=Sphingomonas sp. ABOLG TaxID=1985880 RepID=UPI000F7F9DB0|nr:hypothetical protein [Sphingomonas sp. ABOLG]